MFRDRPLTWLFIAATICVDIAIAIGSSDALASLWQWGFCLGQSAVLGSWLVVGTRHRLERGALFVVAQLMLATVLSNGSLVAWGRMLAPSALYGTMAALGVFVGKICFFRFRVTRDANRSYVLRYSLMELFGWTVVVAIAAAALRHGRLITMFQIPELLLFYLGLSLNIGLVTGLLVDHNNRYRYSLSLSLGCSIAFYLFAWKILHVLIPPYALAFTVSVAYVVIWIVVCRLDAPSPARTAPQTPTDAQKSPPPLVASRATAPPNPPLQNPPGRSRR